jgi:NADPH:quinone reductase-like Zn-dependent oxidoreductase
MSSWVALRRRVDFAPGQTVLILGATGSSGRMAVQVAKRLGAGHIIGAGRDAQRLAALPTLGATEISSGSFELDARAVSLADVEAAWSHTGARERIVITP